jgi:putative membrane protein
MESTATPIEGVIMITAADVVSHYGPYAGGPGWWIIFPIAWFLLIATAIFVFAVRGRRYRWRYGQFAGEQKLGELYATGEIDEQEYHRRLNTLRQSQR